MTIRLLATSAAILISFAFNDYQQQTLPQSSAPPIATANVSSLITGEFSGDTRIDAVVLADGQPVLRDAVEVYQTFIEADVVGVDIATLHGGGANGRDRVAVVGSGGLSLVEFHASGTPGIWTSTVENLRGPTSKWAIALAVRSGDVDGVNGPDLVAVTSGRICVQTADATGGWNLDTNFLAGASITGLELLDWDGAAGGAKEIAICGNWGIAIWRANGTFVTNVSWGEGKVLIEPIADPGFGCDRLATVGTNASTGEQTLAVIWNGGFEGPTALGAEGVVHLAGGDWNGDAYGDLFLGRTSSAAVRVLLNRGTQSGEILGNTTSLSIPIGHPQRPIAVQDGDMAVIDVDSDDDADIVSAIQGTYTGGNHSLFDPRYSAVDVAYNGRIPQTDWCPWHLLASGGGGPLPIHNPVTGTLTISFSPPKTAISGAMFEFAVWRTASVDNLANATPILTPDPVAIPGTGSLTVCELDLDQHVAEYLPRYTLIGRQVRRNTDGTIAEESPALKLTIYSEELVAAMALDPNVVWTSHVINTEKPDDPGGTDMGSGVPPTPPDRRPPP
jgi:hypothetical protein